MSGETPELPASGYSLLKVYTTHVSLEHSVATDPPGGGASHALLSFGFEWRKLSDERFDVMLRIKIDPSLSRPERLVMHLVGQFKRNGTPALSMNDFAKLHAVAILFPYIRQQITTLTTSSFHGPFYLPAVNVGALMEGMKAKEATAKPQVRGGGRKSLPRRVSNRG